METERERRAREATHAERLHAQRHAEQVRQARAAEPKPKGWRRLAAVFGLGAAVLIVVGGFATNADAFYARCNTYVPNPASVGYSPCETGWAPSGAASYTLSPGVGSIPNLLVGAKWGYGFACATSAQLVNVNGNTDWRLYAADYSQACTGPYGIATVRLSIAYHWPSNGQWYAVHYRISVGATGAYAMQYGGPVNESFGTCYIHYPYC